MFRLRTEKVHPSLSHLDDSSSDDDISKPQDAVSNVNDAAANSVDPAMAAIPEGKKDDNEDNKSVWDDLVEDFEMHIEDSLGKCGLYMLDGMPLKKGISNGIGLHVITGEIMKTYGLEFLNVVSDVIMNTVVEQRLSLGKILKQLKTLDFNKNAGKKLIIWIDDVPVANNVNTSFGRRLVTELMSRDIEPDFVVACNDFDKEVLLAIFKAMDEKASLVDSQEELIQVLYKIGLSLALAAGNCNLILIDADQVFYNFQGHHNFMKFAEELGHQVLYLRNNPTITDKEVLIESIVKKVMVWKNGQNMKLGKPSNQNGPSISNVSVPQEPKLSALGAKLKYLNLQESLKASEIRRKLTPEHFVIPKDTYYDSTDSEVDNNNATKIE